MENKTCYLLKNEMKFKFWNRINFIKQSVVISIDKN